MKKPYYFVKIAEGQEREREIIKNKVRLIEKKRATNVTSTTYQIQKEVKLMNRYLALDFILSFTIFSNKLGSL